MVVLCFYNPFFPVNHHLTVPHIQTSIHSPPHTLTQAHYNSIKLLQGQTRRKNRKRKWLECCWQSQATNKPDSSHSLPHIIILWEAYSTWNKPPSAYTRGSLWRSLFLISFRISIFSYKTGVPNFSISPGQQDLKNRKDLASELWK